jgi:hypothetical protein
MVMSLLVLLIPIALLLGFYRLFLGGDEPIVVDARPAIEEAQSAKLFPVAVPTGLATDWRVSNATFRRAATGATLRIGYVDPAGDPVLMVQSSVPPETLVPAELGAGAQAGSATVIGDRTWRRYAGRPGELALVLVEKDRSIIIVGAAGADQLQTLAASLS